MRRTQPLRRTLLLTGLLCASSALAWPVDVRQTLSTGTQREVPLRALSWAETDAPERVGVVVEIAPREVGELEVLPGGIPARQRPQAGATLTLSARAAGDATVLLYAEGNFAVWRVSAGGSAEPAPPDPALVEAARAACPGLTLGAGEGGHLTLEAEVTSEACGDALLPLLKSPAFLARDVKLTFDGAALQRQLTALQAAYAEAGLPVKARYVGAGLILTGTVTPAQHQRALWLTFENALGKVALTDHLEVRATAAAEDDLAAPGSVPIVPQQPARPPAKKRKGR